MMKIPSMGFLYLSVLLFVSLFACSEAAADAAGGGGGGAAEECKENFQKVMMCLDFARGKTASPTKECCTAVEGIKDSDPKCLCYIIQQTHSGGETLKNLGLQEAKLLQLPSACQLKNASVTNCPKLLGLSPSSPDAAIFSDNATSPTGKSSPSTPSAQKESSARAKDGHLLFGTTAFVAITIFFSAFPILVSA